MIDRDYRSGLTLVDFSRAAEEARGKINHWVETKTAQKIRELIPSGGITRNTRLVLVNAVYFKAIWERQFNKALTRNAPFHVEGAGSIHTPFMRQKDRFGYLRSADYQALELPYRGSEISLVVLLPDENDGLEDLESRISPSMLHDCLVEMHIREVIVSLPRFRRSSFPLRYPR